MLSESEIKQLKRRERSELFCGYYLPFLKCRTCGTAFQIHGYKGEQTLEYFPRWIAGDGPGFCPMCEEADFTKFVIIRGQHNRMDKSS